MLRAVSQEQRLTSRRSIEALRSGVPNRAAVRHLGTDQQAIESRFIDSLGQIAAERAAGRQQQGLMVEGEFGTGKSHLLEWLQHVALDAGFACSKVVISKETPLGDPHKMFRSAIESLTLPDRVGGLPEVVERLRLGSQAYADLYELIQDPQLAFDPLFQGHPPPLRPAQPGHRADRSHHRVLVRRPRQRDRAQEAAAHDRAAAARRASSRLRLLRLRRPVVPEAPPSGRGGSARSRGRS